MKIIKLPKFALYGLLATAIAIPFSSVSAQPYSATQKPTAVTKATSDVNFKEAIIEIRKFQMGETLTDAEKDNAIKALLQMVTWFANGDIGALDVHKEVQINRNCTLFEKLHDCKTNGEQ